MTTEENIINAAKEVFVRKGFQGAKMQEIANEAGINKALLHYYFRSKEKLFEQIFSGAFQQLIPALSKKLDEITDIESFIRFFVPFYVDFIQKNPHLPQFVLHELSQNPDRIRSLAANQGFPLSKLSVMIDRAVAEKKIRPIETHSLVINILGLIIFPIIARPMIEGVIFNQNTKSYQNFMAKRSDEVVETILNSIKPQSN
ncbi:MAG: TetR/AcrR family transcriptional regulator [Bacteroidales bacterium]|jgi:AcrR family transcriptional regulator|nr:TetR/AcrR family transcriptional regulator [Bacteroidales bacterium]HOI32423.1 TetR/AcrR family transcriptional regulator [Bacteroidales bacterium]